MSAREMKKIRAENLKCYLDFYIIYTVILLLLLFSIIIIRLLLLF